MKVYIQRAWEELSSSYWFLPSLMTVLAIGLSFATIELDHQLRDELIRSLGWIWGGGAEGTRGLLSTVAGSLITVASLSFSITIVAFTQASSQYGPRLLRTFMSDKANQFVLGTFISTFVYCLLVLRTVRSSNGVEFIPHISTSIALALALISLGVLIFFIHHVALTLQASHLIAGVAADLFDLIDRLFKPGSYYEAMLAGSLPVSPPGLDGPEKPGRKWVRSSRTGYLQGIDLDQLIKTARQGDLTLHLSVRPGDFLIQGKPLVELPPDADLAEEVEQRIQSAFVTGKIRTYTQDVEYAIQQLVEVAVRALSPGVNDPFTAITCIDWLGAALSRLTALKAQSRPEEHDPDHRRLVFDRPITFPELLAAAFDPIQAHSRTDAAVRLRLLEVIGEVLERTRHPDDRNALLEQASRVFDDTLDETTSLHEQKGLYGRYQHIREDFRNP